MNRPVDYKTLVCRTLGALAESKEQVPELLGTIEKAGEAPLRDAYNEFDAAARQGERGAAGQFRKRIERAAAQSSASERGQ